MAPTKYAMKGLALAAVAGQASAMKLYSTQGNSTNGTRFTEEQNEAKMAAVNKVISLLESLQQKALDEGEKEVATYNKFACFCKDTMADKGQAITDGESRQNALDAGIGELADDRDGLDTDISGYEETIETTQGEIDEAKETREKEVKEYRANVADLKAAISALEGAIQQLKASKSPSFAQWQSVAKTIRVATLMADALGLGGEQLKRSSAFFLQEQPDVPTEAYSFHSDDIISTLEGLLTDFKNTKNTEDSEEVEAASTYDLLIQGKENIIKEKNREIDTARQQKAQKQDDIATDSQELTTVSATLLDDKAYLTELSKMCSNKAKTWDARSQARADELAALTSAISIMKGTVSEKTSGATIRFAQRGVTVRLAEAMAQDAKSMEAVEAESEEADAAAASRPAAPVFLQRRSDKGAAPRGDGREVVIDLLRSESKHLKSSMLASLVSQMDASDPFGKIKTLITELIERLQQQANNEANQKGWCDKSMTAAAQKRDFAAEKIRSLNGAMAEKEALRDKLKEEVSVLSKEIEDLEDEQTDADNERGIEKAENNETVSEAKLGKEAVEDAITALDRFYKTAANNATVNVSFVQRGPADDAPDTGFDSGENYQGLSGEAGGVIGMMEVILGDFTRTITETQKAEAQAVQDHLDFTTKTQSSLAEKNVAKTEKTSQKDNAVAKLSEDDEALTAQSGLLTGAIEELMQLHETCVNTGMSYEDRVARREEELEALKKAECILTSYAQYGPDAAVSAEC